MGYQIGFQTPDGMSHPGFACETFVEAEDSVNEAMSKGYLAFDTGIPMRVSVGPGTIYKIVSDERLKTQDEPLMAKCNFMVLAETRLGNMPFGFYTQKAMNDAVDSIWEKDFFWHCAKPGAEYTCIQDAVGHRYLQMTMEQYRERNMVLARQMQQQQQAEEAARSRIHSVR